MINCLSVQLCRSQLCVHVVYANAYFNGKMIFDWHAHRIRLSNLDENACSINNLSSLILCCWVVLIQAIFIPPMAWRSESQTHSICMERFLAQRKSANDCDGRYIWLYGAYSGMRGLIPPWDNGKYDIDWEFIKIWKCMFLLVPIH